MLKNVKNYNFFVMLNYHTKLKKIKKEMIMEKVLLIVLLGVGLLFSSCAKYPQVELDAAKASVVDVKMTGSDFYAPVEFQSLNDSVTKASVLAETEKAKWFSSYKETNLLLANVTNQVAVVKTKTETRKAELKAETEKLLVTVDSLVNANKALLVKAPKGKDGKAALEAINTDINVVADAVNETRVLLAKLNYLEADSKIKAANDKALSINAELVKATAKPAKHKKK